MRASHRLKMTMAHLKADAAARGGGGSGRVVMAMDQAGVEAIDALALELLGHLDRLHAAEPVQDGRERTAQLQNLF
ncbi:MAG: hypothetical protein ABI919_11120, partial [Ramlibacter sp.]